MYLFVSAGKFLSPNCFPMCLSFNHKLLKLSVITSILLFSYVYLVIAAIFISSPFIYRKYKKTIFFLFAIFAVSIPSKTL